MWCTSDLNAVHSNAGGGGERVLWTAIAFMQRTEPNVLSVVYTGDADATKEQILEKVKVCMQNLANSQTEYHTSGKI